MFLTPGITAVILGLMKTAISIPDLLFGQAERLARHLRLSRSELYQRAIAAFVQRHIDTATTEQLDEVYSRANLRRGLDSATEQAQANAILREDW